jgi:KDO2-lipid IV(A) lauroyltransferase
MKILFRWLSRWPLWLLHAVGWVLGWLSFLLSGSYRRRFLANARQAGVPWSRARGAVAQAGRLVAELPYLWLRPGEQPFGRRLRVKGMEVVEQAHAQGRGILFLTPHLGAFEVAAQAYAELHGAAHPVTVLYRPARKAWLRELVDTARGRPGLLTAPATLAGVRQMLRALKRGDSVGLLPDQVPPQGMGEWVPFFGRPAYTMTLAARLVQQTGALVVLIWCRRLPWGRGYEVFCEGMSEPLPPDPEARAECAAIINRAMERMILGCPQQYLWGYHRYKMPADTPHSPTEG